MPTDDTKSGESTPAPKETPVTFTDDQQAAIDKIIQDRLTRDRKRNADAIEAANAAKEEAERKLKEYLEKPTDPSQDQIAEFKRVGEQAKAELEAARRVAEAKAAEAKQAQDRLTDYQKQTAINKAATEAGFIDPAIVVELVKGNVVFGDEGKLTVVGPNGEQRYNASMQPMTLDEFVAEFASKRPYLVRGNTTPGAGGSSGSSYGNQIHVEVEQVFGPTSNGKLANELARRDPAKYKSLRAMAVAKGLLA